MAATPLTTNTWHASPNLVQLSPSPLAPPPFLLWQPGPLVNVWDLSARRIIQRLRGHANNDALALDASRGRLACGGRMNELRVWEFL